MACVICYGSLAVDRVICLPRWIVPGDDLHCTHEANYPGGTAINVGLTLSDWGHEVRLGGNVLGCDWPAGVIRQRLRDYQISDEWVADSPEQSTVTCTVLVTPDGERTIIGHSFGVAKAGPLPSLEGAGALSLDTYGPDRIEIAQTARAAGLWLSASDIHELDHPLLPLLDLVTYSQAWLERHIAAEDIDAWLLAAARCGPRWIGVTDSAHPVRLLADGAWYTATPPVLSRVVDSTGAGDTFRAGLLHGVLSGWSPQQSLEWAVQAATARCTVLGAAERLPAIQK